MKLSPWLLVLLAVVTLVLTDRCAYSRGKRDASARQRDSVVDSRIGRLAGDLVMAEARHERERDSTARVIDRLRRRVVPVDTMYVRTGIDSLPPFVIEQFIARDSVIAAQDTRHRADSLRLLFWQASAVTYRDSIVPALVTARDAYRVRAERPRHLATNILGGALVGYGVAKESPAVVLTGAAVVVVPRVIQGVRDVLGRLPR